MKPSKIFLGTLLFFGLWTGGSQFMTDAWSNHDVQTDNNLTLTQDYERMQQAVDGNNNSLRTKVETLSTDQGGVIDAASAGLLLVPQFVTDVLAVPFTALAGAVNSIASAFSPWLPGWMVTLVRMIIFSTIGFAILSLALGVKS